MVDYRLGKRTRFTENIQKQSRIPSGELVRAMVLPADANVAKHLHIRKGAAVVLIESIGKVDGRPISIVAHHFPAKRFPDMIEIYKRERSVTKAFAHYGRSEEHTSELHSLMRISYAVFCLKKKNKEINTITNEHNRTH